MKRNFNGWSVGQAYVNGRTYQTYNPPTKKAQVEKPLAPPKDEIIYRDIFILRPVYQTHTASVFERVHRFLGYQAVARDGGYFWPNPRTLKEAKEHADYLFSYVRACEAVARSLQSLAVEDEESTEVAA